ncbi:TPA: hypothetical protein ACQVLZ_004920 [Serratia marcescens]
MEKLFSPVAARKAQVEYCNNKHVPHFAPYDGICFRCKKDIYQQHGLRGYETGISLDEAKKHPCYLLPTLQPQLLRLESKKARTRRASLPALRRGDGLPGNHPQ